MTNVYTRGAAAALLLVVTGFSVPVLAADSVQARLDSLERKLDSRGLLDMLNRIEEMQRDIQQLRGDIEVQTHTLESIQRRSREQYLDIDRRLQQLETGQAGTAAPTMPAVTREPAPAPTPTLVAPVPTTAQQPTAAVAPAAVTNTVEERAAYDTALAVLREGRYAEATQAFNDFLARYPNSTYADNATYWLGETHYVNRDFNLALASFQGLVEKYPGSPKVSDSLLKTGYIYYEQRDWEAARQVLESVVKDYPGTTAARLASDRLARMKKEGH